MVADSLEPSDGERPLYHYRDQRSERQYSPTILYPERPVTPPRAGLSTIASPFRVDRSNPAGRRGHFNRQIAPAQRIYSSKSPKTLRFLLTIGERHAELPLSRIVENDADGLTAARPEAADAVTQVYAIRAPRPLHGTIVNRENNAISLSKRHYHWPALHAWALLGHDEFTASEIRAGVGQLDLRGGSAGPSCRRGAGQGGALAAGRQQQRGGKQQGHYGHAPRAHAAQGQALQALASVVDAARHPHAQALTASVAGGPDGAASHPAGPGRSRGLTPAVAVPPGQPAWSGGGRSPPRRPARGRRLCRSRSGQ